MANARGACSRAACFCIVTATLAASAPVLAGDMAAAEALFREGRELLEKGDVNTACEKFAESQRLDPSSGTMLNLASCHERQGKTATAWAEFLAAARLARSQGRPERAEEAESRARGLEPKLAYVRITTDARVEGLTIHRDEVKLDAGALRSRIPIDPGKHVVRASAEGYEPWSLEVVIQTGEDAVVRIPSLTKAPPPPANDAQPTNTPDAKPSSDPTADAGTDITADSSSRTLAYVLGGVGVAATGVGTYFGLRAMSTYDNADAACPSHTNCPASAMDTRDDASSQALLSNVLFGVGIVGIGASVALLLTSGSGSDKNPGESSSVSIVPHATQSSTGAAITGTF